jgi:hypothetical protein
MSSTKETLAKNIRKICNEKNISVETLVCVLNEHQVAPEHVKDVITDYLCEI